MPPRVAPELAAAVGSATQADAVLYVNVKGVVTTPGRQTATVLTAVFFVVIVAAIVLALASQKGGGGGHGVGGGGGGSHVPRGRHRVEAAPAGAACGRPSDRRRFIRARSAAPAVRPAPPVGGWRGGGRPPGVVRGGPVYLGGGFGLNLIVPLDEPIYTHDGSIAYDDPIFAGDELYVSMTLVSTYDGRVLWHARDSLDLEANNPAHVDRMVQAFLDTLPPALPPPPPPPALPPSAVQPPPTAVVP